jgi:hypothetical protein
MRHPITSCVPLAVYEGGNCLFRAASLVATGDENNYDCFRKLVMKELYDSAKYYSDLLVADAEDQGDTLVMLLVHIFRRYCRALKNE